MAMVFAIAVLMIFVGFIRAFKDHASDDETKETDEAGGEEGIDTPPQETPGDDAAPEDPDRVSAPPWEAYPDSKWALRDVEPVPWKGGSPPTMMEMFERVPDVDPEAPVDGWVMPEPDPALMEDPEEYGIDNGDPEEPMWTPPEPPEKPEPAEPRQQGFGISVLWNACLIRAILDLVYILQRAVMISKGEGGSFRTGFQLSIPGGLELMMAAAGILLLLDLLMLVLIRRRSYWITAAFLIYILFDLGLRAMDIMNGTQVGGQMRDTTFAGVALAAGYDLVAGLYILRPGGMPEAPDPMD